MSQLQSATERRFTILVYFFGALGELIAFFFVLGLVPETTGRSLEKIEADMRQQAQPPVLVRP